MARRPDTPLEHARRVAARARAAAAAAGLDPGAILAPRAARARLEARLAAFDARECRSRRLARRDLLRDRRDGRPVAVSFAFLAPIGVAVWIVAAVPIVVGVAILAAVAATADAFRGRR